MYLKWVLLYLPEFMCCRLYCSHHLRCYSSSIISLGHEPCLKTTSTVPCSNILLNSIHCTWYFSFHPTLTCFHSFFAISFTPVLPPSLWKWLRTPQYLIPDLQEEDFLLLCSRYWALTGTCLQGCRVKWTCILNFMGVFFGKSKRIVIYRRWGMTKGVCSIIPFLLLCMVIFIVALSQSNLEYTEQEQSYISKSPP